MGSYVKGIILIIVLLFLVTFGVKNSQPIQLYYHLNFETGCFPLYALAYISIVIGIVIGMLVGIYARIDLRRRIRRLQRENKELKERVEEKVVEEEKEEEAPVTAPAVEREEIDQGHTD
ncbi:MAG: DUF1049 domain-containing protein [Deltaproteobacteria bacterium]|nr:MAG: DUF1049 domain-containing protein [Deltaproteobacteria bacterium]